MIDWTSFRNGIARIEGKVRQLQFIRIGVFSVDTFEKMPCSVAYNVDKGIKVVDALGRHWILPMNACDLWRVRLMHQRYLILSSHTSFHEIENAPYYLGFISWRTWGTIREARRLLNDLRQWQADHQSTRLEQNNKAGDGGRHGDRFTTNGKIVEGWQQEMP